MALMGPGTSYPDDDAVEAANMQACIDARRAAGILDVEHIDEVDCEEECPIRLTGCPIGRRS